MDIRRRVVRARLGEALEPQCTGVATAARLPRLARVVAAQGDGVVHAERAAELDDLALGEVYERRADADRRRALHAAARGEVRHALERGDVRRAAVGIAGIVDGVDTDEDVRRA